MLPYMSLSSPYRISDSCQIDENNQIGWYESVTDYNFRREAKKSVISGPNYVKLELFNQCHWTNELIAILDRVLQLYT